MFSPLKGRHVQKWPLLWQPTRRNVAYTGFVICMVLFCGYMQWSPVVDFDYVWIGGHEHNVGAVNPHQMDSLAMPISPQPVATFIDDSAYQPFTSAITQSMESPEPPTTLRL